MALDESDDDSTSNGNSARASISELPFPPLTKAHILNCSYHAWYPRYRQLTPKARIIPLPNSFIAYLRADGIVLPPEPRQRHSYSDPLTPPASEIDSDDGESYDDESTGSSHDPSERWRDLHAKVQQTIKELGGSVMPKLNWSAPKDATWISTTNSMECQSANDVYLLLKSSDFITHDLEQAWDGINEDDSSEQGGSDHHRSRTTSEAGVGSRNGDDIDDDDESADDDIPFHLILRKTIPAYNPAVEFRCFVRSRQLLCICQRDLNHYPFLTSLVSRLRSLIQAFHNEHLMRKFANADFVFDVYIPPPHDRVWLIDINPWAVRTDPLLFSWLELLTMPTPEQIAAASLLARVDLGPGGGSKRDEIDILTGTAGIDSDRLIEKPHASKTMQTSSLDEGNNDRCEDDEDEEDDEAEEIYIPEFRLVNKDDPEAYAFNSPKYSAHKLPKDVVDAGASGPSGLREFLGTWREIQNSQQKSEPTTS